MDFQDQKLLGVASFQAITGLNLVHAKGFIFHACLDSWVLASYKGNKTGLIMASGLFPAKLIQIEYLSDLIVLRFKVKLHDKYGSLGLTESIRRRLSMPPGIGEIEGFGLSCSQPHDTGDLIGEVDVVETLSKCNYQGAYILGQELDNFCKFMGVLNYEQRLQAWIDEFGYVSSFVPVESDVEAYAPFDNPLLASQTVATDSTDAQCKKQSLHPETSQALLDAIEATNQFWAKYKPDDPSTIPRQEEIVNWLMKGTKGRTKAMAEAIAKVVNDGRKQSGGRPRSE